MSQTRKLFSPHVYNDRDFEQEPYKILAVHYDALNQCASVLIQGNETGDLKGYAMPFESFPTWQDWQHKIAALGNKLEKKETKRLFADFF